MTFAPLVAARQSGAVAPNNVTRHVVEIGADNRSVQLNCVGLSMLDNINDE